MQFKCAPFLQKTEMRNNNCLHVITHTFEWSQELMLMDLLHKVNDQVWFPQFFQKVSVQGGPVLPPGKAGACFKDAVVRAGEKSRVSPACKESHGQLKFIFHIIHYHKHTQITDFVLVKGTTFQSKMNAKLSE